MSKLWLKIHAAEQVGEARVRAQGIEQLILTGSERNSDELYRIGYE
jgi:hypothetical protein